MVLLETDKFLTELEKCLTASKAKKKGSVFVTMKRYDGRTKPIPRKSATSTPVTAARSKCLIRVKYGERKLSCHVGESDLNHFQVAFSSLMRSGMGNIGKTSAQPQQPPPPVVKSVGSQQVSTGKPSSTAVPPKTTKSLPTSAPSPKRGKS